MYNVWGSWCAPCRREAPDLRRLANELEGRAAFVGINVRDSDGSARAFERAHRIGYPSVRTADSSQALLAFGSSLGVAAVATTMVVDAESRLAARVVGPVSHATLKALVETVLAAAPKRP